MDEIDFALHAISPLDGRYRERLRGLAPLVSEEALIGYRLEVEAQWLLHLAESLPAGVVALTGPQRAFLEGLSGTRDAQFARDIKHMEQKINHDVKAVEYYLRGALSRLGAGPETLAFIHFACTSEDINNLAYARMMDDARKVLLLPTLDRLLHTLSVMARTYAEQPMLARTHGQGATPTTLGKEVAVFGYRILRQRQRLAEHNLTGKINGAIGAYNAHVAAFPDVPWPDLCKDFVCRRMGLRFNPLTTQIESHDTFVERLDVLRHLDGVLLGLCRDFWGYISLGYLRQRSRATEVGSSTMPHKVNPIDFENAEGNLGLAVALADHLTQKLLASRWQRDLSDSTVLRSVGSFLGHSLLAWESILRGLDRVQADPATMAADLEDAWEVLGEAIQVVMRRYGVMDAYERLKDVTRGRSVSRGAMMKVVAECDAIPEDEKQRLAALTPSSYIGLAPQLVETFVAGVEEVCQ